MQDSLPEMSWDKPKKRFNPFAIFAATIAAGMMGSGQNIPPMREYFDNNTPTRRAETKARNQERDRKAKKAAKRKGRRK